MTLEPDKLKAIAAEWRSARCLYVLYKAIAQQFELDAPACRELELPLDRSEPEVLEAVRAWLDTMDQAIGVHQLRLFLQTSPLSSEIGLRVLVEHHLQRQGRSDMDRDKLDFLLVQYFSQCAPVAGKVMPELGEVARVLQSVIGQPVSAVPGNMPALKEMLGRMDRCHSLRELLKQGILQDCRKLKLAAGEAYFEPAMLAGFAWFNFGVRRTFFRLMHADVIAIRQGAQELIRRGVQTLNCEAASLSREESLEHVVELCRRWKKPFQAEYSAGNPFTQLMELRTVVDEAVKQAPPPAVVPKPVAAAAAAPKPAAKAAPQKAPVPGLAASTAELQKIIAQLKQYLIQTGANKQGGAATIVLGGARLPLSSYEAATFLRELGDFSQVVQRGVAMRVLLVQSFEQFRQGGSDALHAFIPDAKALARELDAAQDEARQDHDVEATAAISGTAQRLGEVIEDVEKLSATNELVSKQDATR